MRETFKQCAQRNLLSDDCQKPAFNQQPLVPSGSTSTGKHSSSHVGFYGHDSCKRRRTQRLCTYAYIRAPYCLRKRSENSLADFYPKTPPNSPRMAVSEAVPAEHVSDFES
ncbi:uncharacterized protein AKAW2_50239S [Aspergillus luchuensis]|uniref:Uncharacterized protein n=1 Tax=Aspergillus kawachii TaxID=1069201 RepID=A0A7R7WBG3_ASPKA|nr:uncharacterized protein AKAW2_50239S [Aspergillus luchuensis]BCR99897.1 hypothetical protein AKAW2_50239S [Aspergillus luchuensis]